MLKPARNRRDLLDTRIQIPFFPRTAALDLVRTFDLEPAPLNRTEKRHG
jgi:hypothetical protein